MELIFLGTGGFALPSLEALFSSPHRVKALVTQPDRPAGRGHGLRVPRTKVLALRHGIEVHQPPKIRAEGAVALLRELAPDAMVVVAYGQILPKAILEIPRKGILNVHGSLLPRYRGAAPVQWAIARGESETGVTTMLMDEGLDTGPILEQRSHPIREDHTGGSLERELSRIGAELLLSTLSRWERGELVPVAQDDSRASLAPRIRKEDGRIDWTWSARDIHRRVRAFDPWPVAYAELASGPLKIWKTRVAPDSAEETAPGRIVGYEDRGLLVACGGHSRLVLEEVQAPGRSRMGAADYARGRRLSPGDSLAT